jgi:predicted RNA polymerase sigma factor
MASRAAGSRRVSVHRGAVPADQDRDRWDRELIAEGRQLVRACLRRGQPGRYQIEAAVHSLLHAIRAYLLGRLGRPAEAVAEYEKAIGLTGNAAERRFLRQRAAACR